MQLDVRKALKYPFDDPDWLKKVGIYAGFVILTSLLSSALNLVSEFTGTLSDITAESNMGEYTGMLLQMAPSLSLLFINLITFPVNLYFSGYMTLITKNVMNGEEAPLPDHSDLGEKFRLWLGTFITGLVPGFIQLILVGVIGGPLVLLTIWATNADAAGIMIALTVMAWIVGGFMLVAILLFMNLLIIPSMQYLYLKNEDFSEIFNIHMIKEVIMKAWKELLLLTGIMYVLNFLGSLLAAVLCFISFIVKPLVTIIISLSGSHLTGQVYKTIKNDDLLRASADPDGDTMVQMEKETPEAQTE